jgi:hypothetical protein
MVLQEKEKLLEGVIILIDNIDGDKPLNTANSLEFPGGNFLG